MAAPIWDKEHGRFRRGRSQGGLVGAGVRVASVSERESTPARPQSRCVLRPVFVERRLSLRILLDLLLDLGRQPLPHYLVVEAMQVSVSPVLPELFHQPRVPHTLLGVVDVVQPLKESV